MPASDGAGLESFSGTIRAGTRPMTNNSDHLLAACRRLEENCLYTSQTHFEMASQKATRAKGWMVLLPSAISSVSGLIVALGAPGWVGAFAAIAGVVSGVATFLGVDKDATAHEMAGKLLTQLRHEARALSDTYSPDMPVDRFAADLRALENRYGAFVASLPLTDDKAFEKVRGKIKSGTFQYDSEASPALDAAAPRQALPAPTKDGG
jgi:hypothetical protein